MTIGENLERFYDLPVRDYTKGQGLDTPDDVAYRVRIDWDAYDSGTRLTDVLAALLNEPNAGELRALVIGAWDFESSTDSSAIVETLVSAKATLGNLEALFFGDITFEEQEISWIQQSDISPLFSALPNLRALRVRGADGLQVGTIAHDNLEELAFESGGLPRRIVGRVANAALPKLRHLELWLGDDGYGYDGNVDDLAPFFAGERFPALKYLGLKDSVIQDDIAKAVATAAVLSTIEVLDLSMGVLTDAGAEALLAADLSRLKKLDIHHHYVSPELVSKLEAKVAEVDANEPQQADGDYRYIAVAE